MYAARLDLPIALVESYKTHPGKIQRSVLGMVGSRLKGGSLMLPLLRVGLIALGGG
nr:hypothetical protein Itr_chr05CG13600 [Ipomoea trifida]